jgi:biotin carboxylase
LTTADDSNIADMAYILSQGREKNAMTKERELRKPATWAGPTLVTTNISLHQELLQDPGFIAGGMDNHHLERLLNARQAP